MERKELSEVDRIATVIADAWGTVPNDVHKLAKAYLALRALADEGRDKERLDWLENEVAREQEYLSVERSQRTGPVPNSLFRRNVPITREAIDAAMKGSHD